MAHYGVRPFISMALLLGAFLHVEIADQAEEECVDNVGKGPDPSRARTARRAIFLDHDHRQQEFTGSASVEPLANCFKSNRAEQPESKHRYTVWLSACNQRLDGDMPQGGDNRQQDSNEQSRAESNQVMDNQVDNAGPDPGPEAHARQSSGLSKVGDEGRKVDPF